METCLTLKLDSSITDERIERVGEYTLFIPQMPFNSYLSQLSTINVYNGSARLVGNGYFTNFNNTANYGKLYNFNQNAPLFVNTENGDCYVFIKNKYITRLIGYIASDKIKLDLNTFMGCKLLTAIAGNAVGTYVPRMGEKITGDTQYLPPNIQIVVTKKIKGDISYLSKYTSLRKFINSDLECKGDISSIYNLINLTVLDLSGTSVTGNVNDFIEKMSALRKDGTSLKLIGNNYLLYNGENIKKDGIIITFNENVVVS